MILRTGTLLCLGFAPLLIAGCAPRALQTEQEGIQVVQIDSNGSAVSLEGPWAFYWNRLLFPPDFHEGEALPPDAVIDEMRPWNGIEVGGMPIGAQGMATYRMKFRLEGMKDRAALWLPHQFSAVRVFINGQLKGGVGTIGTKVEETVSARADTFVTFEAEGVNELIVQVANHSLFQGGMRGNLVMGSENAVRRYVWQRMALEILTMGIVFGAAVYHLGFYLLNRSQTSFLFFSLICFMIVLRIPLQASKTYAIFLDPISWEMQARILAGLNTWSIPLGFYYVRSLFPEFVQPRANLIYIIPAVCVMLMQFAPLSILSRANLFYTTVMLGVLVFHSLGVLRQAFKAQRSAFLMILGIGALGLLSGFALIQNWRGQEGSVFALASFFFFVLFQALALSRYFQSAIRAEAVLTERLRESTHALTRQREQLQVNLHDSLGGALTDLQVHTEQQMRSGSGIQNSALSAIHDRITDTVKMFRSQLLFMEDLEMTAQDLLPGIQMTLLRRYADAGRELDFDVSPEAVRAVEEATEGIPSVDRVLEMFFLVTELCTNDLKYGQGESFWRISRVGRGLCIVQKNGMRNPGAEIHAPHRAGERVRNLAGTIGVEALGGEYSVEIYIPLVRG